MNITLEGRYNKEMLLCKYKINVSSKGIISKHTPMHILERT